MVVVEIEGGLKILFTVLCMYGNNNKAFNREMFRKLVSKWKPGHTSDKVIMGGDSNIAPGSW